jgi:malonate decarboxylase alpha subunit
MQAVMQWMSGPVLPTDRTVETLEALVVAGDRIVLEGDNQKQADFLSRSLVKVDAKKIHDLHLIISSISRLISSISRPEHLTLFELGIAKKVDFAFAGPQSLRFAQLLEDGVLEIGAVPTYVSCTLACWSISSQTSSFCAQSRRTAKAIFLRDRIQKTHLSLWRLRLSTTRS